MEYMKECPVCGSKELRQGKQRGYARMFPLNSFLQDGSNIIATICSDCGHILSTKVEKPQQFK